MYLANKYSIDVQKTDEDEATIIFSMSPCTEVSLHPAYQMDTNGLRMKECRSRTVLMSLENHHFFLCVLLDCDING